jgi:transposase-like protein
MVTEMIIHLCRRCGSSNIVKNGHNASGSQQFWGKDCGKRGVLQPRRGYTEEQKEQILAAYYQRPSMRGIERIFGVSRHTLAKWLEKKTAPTRR